MDYPIKRMKRKSITILVNRDGNVEVRAPLHVSRNLIEDFVRQKSGWIAAKQAQARARAKQRAAFAPEVGGTVSLLGRETPLRSGPKAEYRDGVLYLREGCPAKREIESACRVLAKQYLPERVQTFAAGMGVLPSAVRITSASTRFGSCSGKNSLNFTWKLIFAPPDLIDYVVVHELCHIRQHNHSVRFWAEVESVLPDYREREQRLKEFGRQLLLQDWDVRSN